MTLAAAQALCANDTACFGFEFFSKQGRVPSPSTVLACAFLAPGRFQPDRGNIVTIHNPSPVVVNGRALVVFGRNTQNVLAIRALDENASSWGEAVDITHQITEQVRRRSASGGRVDGAITPGPPGGIAFAFHQEQTTATAATAAAATAAATAMATVKRSGSARDPRGIDSGSAMAAPERIAIAIGGSMIGGGAALLSDDKGVTWRVSALANDHGGEAQVAQAPNGSLLLNSRGPKAEPSGRDQGVRWQSVSDDGGASWSAPRILNFSFGSSCEGSIARVPDSDELIFSHPGGRAAFEHDSNIKVSASSALCVAAALSRDLSLSLPLSPPTTFLPSRCADARGCARPHQQPLEPLEPHAVVLDRLGGDLGCEAPLLA